jgi:two-component system response regulator NreC
MASSAKTSAIRVFIVSTEAILRASLRALVKRHKEMQVVGESRGDKNLISLLRRRKPDVILLVAPPGTPECLKATRKALNDDAELKIVLVTRKADPASLLAFIHAGISGYVLLTTKPDCLLEAIERAARRHYFIDPAFSDHIAALLLASAKYVPHRSTASQLSPRERQVLQYTAEGHTNQETARIMRVSARTVETFQSRIKEKLGLKTRTDLVRYAVSAGLLRHFAEAA